MKQIFLILLTAILFTACKKDKTDTNDPSSALVGKWSGEIVDLTGVFSSKHSMELFSNGTLKFFDGDFSSPIYGTGTWTLDSYLFKADVSFPTGEKFSLQAIRNGDKLQQGTLGFTPSTSGFRTWYMNKL